MPPDGCRTNGRETSSRAAAGWRVYAVGSHAKSRSSDVDPGLNDERGAISG
jgi:hypothetical protein